MTGNQLFERALDLLGLRNENAQAPSDTDDLAARALSLINTVIAENAVLDGRISRSEHSVKCIDSLEDEIGLTDIVVLSVLPYGLARLLALGEDDALASSMARLYEESRRTALSFGKAGIAPITEVYR